MKKHLLGYVLLLGLLLSRPLRAFISPDPEGHVASMDLYSYCNGDPVNQYDPDGRFGKASYGGLASGADGLLFTASHPIVAFNNLSAGLGSLSSGLQGIYSDAQSGNLSGYAPVFQQGLREGLATLSNPSAFGRMWGQTAFGVLTAEAGGVAMNSAKAVVAGASQGSGVMAGVGRISAEGGTRTVSRWMAQAEYDAMVDTGRVLPDASGGKYILNETAVSARPGAVRPGSVHAQFEIPVGSRSAITDSLKGWEWLYTDKTVRGRLDATRRNPASANLPTITNPRIIGGN